MSETRPPSQASRSTPRARLDALAASQQSALLDPAEAEFADRGFAAASLNRILAAAGMSKGQAYYYIRDKADLYAAVIERAFQRLLEEMDFTMERPDDAAEFWHRVEQLFARLSQTLTRDRRLAALACGIHESATTRAALEATNLDLRGKFDALLVLGQSLGAIRADLPPSLLMDMLFGMAVEADRWFAAHWSGLDAAEALRLNAAVVAMMRAAASPPGAGAPVA